MFPEDFWTVIAVDDLVDVPELRVQLQADVVDG